MPDPATDAPARIGRYRVLRRLGQGGMGIVYLAVADGSLREVALKVLGEHATDDDSLRRFLREARALATVRHPHVVGCVDFGIEDGRVYLAMEVMSGGDLWQRVKRDGPLPEAEAVRLIAGAARGLQALHEAGVLHRDLKPANLFVDGEGRARIADLGLARFHKDDEHLTQSGAVVGTPVYLSPEQAAGGEDLDPRTDVYGLGATLFALLTGQAPYTGGSTLAILAQVLRGPAPDPRALRPDLSPRIAAVVRKAMARDRRERYGDATAFAVALDGGSDPRSNRRRVLVPIAACAAVVIFTVALAPLARTRTRDDPAPAQVAVAAPAVPLVHAPEPTIDAPAALAALAAAPAQPPIGTDPVAPSGPPPATWARATGTDAHGTWADLVVDGVRQRFRWCPPGSYQRGSPDDEPMRSPIEARHRVELRRGFWIGDTEVTIALWRAGGGKPPETQGDDQLPVAGVTWDECHAVTSALGRRASAPLRLPTEAEWEYACRAGSDGVAAGPIDRLAWHRGNAAGSVHPVAQLDPNPWGVHDAHGNLWEWCADGFVDFTDLAGADQVDPVSAGSRKVLRGGSIRVPASECRSALRDAANPGLRRETNGLRLAISAAASTTEPSLAPR